MAKSCHLPTMLKLTPLLILPLLVSGCAEKACAPARANWSTSGTPNDILTLDSHDRILWNAQIISFERLRDTLNKADAEAHVVRLLPDASTSCAMIEKVRLAMDRSLSCGQGRCLKSAPAR